VGGQGGGEPVTVQVCPELAALRVADPGQAVRSRRCYRLFCRRQVVPPGDEGDQDVGVARGSRRWYARPRCRAARPKVPRPGTLVPSTRSRNKVD
jgi:hypothetical protein